MRLVTHSRSRRTVRIALAALVLLVIASDTHAARRSRPAAPPPPAAAPEAPAAPVVRESAINLQAAFANEVQAKERYLAFAVRADAEGHADVARLFRACAAAEAVHAHRHVEAIAVTGGQARAVLQRIVPGTTAENLAEALRTERWEVESFYPAMRARALAEHRSDAVRSFTFALGAERDHVRLLAAALAGLGAGVPVAACVVCPGCGRTLTAPPEHRCPNCFTPASRYRRIA